MEQKEFNDIFISLKDKVFKYARAVLSDTAEAEDVTQDIFEKLWSNNNNEYQYKNVEPYLIRSTKNLCLDRIKHKKVVAKNSENIKLLSNHHVEPVGEKKEVSQIIKTIINELPKKQRMIIHLRDIEGYEFDEIIEATGIEPNAIRVNLSRARKTVKQELIKTMNYGL
ncbi:MAG: RNA polymerase sigma factor [Bacteroidetes bacterium]|jgi:RNA polymerase sigma factor (sigma-70 family)|nr:RNA polymerase sigma factor [Bacteroidota bacterium]MBT6045953.1 RNA polymerase sigma factor [Candidatus Scalindua sp.]MBT7466216.1 RNA polymerase sigma factor [Bacteroidota bacterium]